MAQLKEARGLKTIVYTYLTYMKRKCAHICTRNAYICVLGYAVTMPHTCILPTHTHKNTHTYLHAHICWPSESDSHAPQLVSVTEMQSKGAINRNNM